MATQHTFNVQLHRRSSDNPIDGGTITFYDEDYVTFGQAEALAAILPDGHASERLDLSLTGYIRWRGILMPADDFERLELQLVAKGR